MAKREKDNDEEEVKKEEVEEKEEEEAVVEEEDMEEEETELTVTYLTFQYCLVLDGELFSRSKHHPHSLGLLSRVKIIFCVVWWKVEELLVLLLLKHETGKYHYVSGCS